MRVGVPREIKTLEFRVGLVPASVRELVHHGHQVFVETGAGGGIGFSDDDYRRAGATVLGTAKEVFEKAEMIVKVKEPQPAECKMLREGQTLFTYLHLAADKAQAEGLMKSGATCIAYETVTDRAGGLPLLAPMSEVAGRMAIQVGARLAALDLQFGGQLNTIYSTVDALETYVPEADLVVGAVLVPGAAAPKLVTRSLVKKMRPGSCIVDIAIDQGGCCETSRPTTHAKPTYVEEGVVHYCVTNMPGAVPRTSAAALNNATLPFVLAIAGKGAKRAMLEDPHLLAGLNVYKGRITFDAVARDLGYDYRPAKEALAA
jgi:alanine dehydrogenase